MPYEFQPVEALINSIKEMTGFLSSLISRKLGLVLMVIVLGAIVTTVVLG